MVKIKIIIFGVFLLAILSYSVNSFGVSSPYWDENPLYVNPGESKEVVMVLQNMVGDEDITAIAELNSGKEIATLTDKSTTYNIPLGNSNVPVNLLIKVPENAKFGQEWQVGVSVKTIAPDTGGVSIGTGVSKGFKVIVRQPETTTGRVILPELSTQTLGFLVLIAILIILVLIIKHFHKKRVIKE